MADILILSIIVTLMSVVWAFTLTYTVNYQAGQGGAILERLTIEDVWFYDSTLPKDKNNKLNVTVYNYGKLPINISIIFLDGRPCTFTLYDALTGRTKLSEINVGSSGRLHIEIPVDIQAGNYTVYNIKIFTKRGYSYEGNYMSPAG